MSLLKARMGVLVCIGKEKREMFWEQQSMELYYLQIRMMLTILSTAMANRSRYATGKRKVKFVDNLICGQFSVTIIEPCIFIVAKYYFIILYQLYNSFRISKIYFVILI